MNDQRPPDAAADAADKTRQLASDILDAMDKPGSVEREQYEQQKDREDRKSLERFYRATGQRKQADAEAVHDQTGEK